MKKIKIISLVFLAALFIGVIAPASAASEGIKDFNEAAGGKNILLYPLYLTGGDGFNDAEGSASLFDGKGATKYCTDQLPYNADWKYEKAYTAERIILRTGGDNKSYPRRMGDGWTLSGSNDYVNWTVIYTGSEDDVLNENNTCYYVDLPDNKEAYQYYRLNADGAASDQDNNAIQLSMFLLCVDASVEVPAERPYITRPNVITGRGVSVIEAPDFDSGKYFETNAADGQHQCRPEEEVQTSYCGDDYTGRVNDDGKPLDGNTIGCIGWTAAGEWVQYTVDVRRTGVYQFEAWIAAGVDSPGMVEIYLGDDILAGSAQSPNDGWQAYSKITAGTVEMTEGEYVIKVLFPLGNINLQALEVRRTGDIEVPTEATEAPEAAADTESEGAAEAAPGGDGAAEKSGEGSSMPIFIAIGAALLVIIVIALVIVTKKKK